MEGETVARLYLQNFVRFQAWDSTQPPEICKLSPLHPVALLHPRLPLKGVSTRNGGERTVARRSNNSIPAKLFIFRMERVEGSLSTLHNM